MPLVFDLLTLMLGVLVDQSLYQDVNLRHLSHKFRQLEWTNFFPYRNGKYGNVKYDCTYCADQTDTYAEVFPADDTTIYLCGYYWNAPNCGVDSKQGNYATPTNPQCRRELT